MMNLRSKALLAVLIMLMTQVALGQVPVSYQGQLIESGTPYTGAVDMEFAFFGTSVGGTPQLIVSKPGVAVQEGLFQVELNMAGLDLSQAWYLEARVEGTALLPRQRVTASPFALYALSGPAAGGVSYENVIVVAKSGGDYESIADALDSITDSSSRNTYLVWVAPGAYIERRLVNVPGHVHLHGSGASATSIISSRGASTPDSDAATVALQDRAQLSHVAVENDGGGPFGIAVYSTLTGRDTVIDNISAHALGGGSGGGRYGLFLADAAPTVRNSQFKAAGATGFGSAVNAGLGSVNISGGFPQALILNSVFLGGASSTVRNCNDNSGTGFGMQLSQSTPDIRGSHICGGHRGVVVLQNGHPRIQNSEIRVSANSNSFLFEITAAGSISVAHSALSYVGNKFTGAGTGLRCVHNHSWGTWLPLSNGTTVAAACN